MDKILSTRSYGICVFSLGVLQDFLKKKEFGPKNSWRNFKRIRTFI